MLLLASLVCSSSPATAAPRTLEDFKLITFNLQGATNGRDSKWTTDVPQLMRNHDILALQEAGAQPRGTLLQTHTPEPGLPSITESRWRSGTGSRGHDYYVYFMETDPTGHRVNLAMVTRERASRVYAVNNAFQGSRPAFGVRIDDTIYYTLHAMSGNGNDGAILIGYIAAQAARAGCQFAAMGDFNREPDGLRPQLPGGTYLHNSNLPTHYSPTGVDRELDYMVTDRTITKTTWKARRTNGRSADHFPVDFGILGLSGGAPTTGWLCGHEWESCEIKGNSTVIYGTGNPAKDIYKNFQGPPPGGGAGATVTCSNTTFEKDPAPGSEKQCWVEPVDQVWNDTMQMITSIDNGCLTADENDNNNISIKPCVQLAMHSQMWNKVAADRSIRARGLCMEPDTSTLVRLGGCIGSSRQVWEAKADGSLYHPATQMCLAHEVFPSIGDKPYLTGCNRSMKQSWRWPSNSLVMSTGMCLSARSPEPNSGVSPEPCTASDLQSWEFGPSYSLRNARSGNCLLPYHKIVEYSVWVSPCVGQTQWRMNATSNLALQDTGLCLSKNSTLFVDPPGLDSMYLKWCAPNLGYLATFDLDPEPIKLAYNNLCIDHTTVWDLEGNTAELWTCNGTVSQELLMAPNGTIHSQSHCLEPAGTDKGSTVQLRTCNNSDTQVWVPRIDYDTSGGREHVYNPGTGLCLSADYPQTAGRLLTIQPCGEVDTQWWTSPAFAS
ncbi:ricin-type beta-trefoil lectin domain protein [Streptomyces sp. NPDC051364]|uniref:ricin-type beta-trefoil lectin domain protein n=1 Tax=Streptomyces sp. NPDC051364 TaxID=3155799 RepID=UPI00343834E2